MPNFQYEENWPSGSGRTVVKNACFGTFSKLDRNLTVPQNKRLKAEYARASNSESMSSEVQPLINFLKILIHFHFFHYCWA